MLDSLIQIKKKFIEANIDDIPKLIMEYQSDSRIGILNLKKQFQKKYLDFQNEKIRLFSLNKYENIFYKKNCTFIAGIDEVGRGTLAGPVVVCCCILPPNTFIEGINDSKKLSASQREKLDLEIKKIAIDYKFGIIDNDIIDEINILNATYDAMKIAIKNLSIKPDVLLVDAVKIPDVEILQESIIGGDGKSISIAAASILAKVYRDNLMLTYSKIYTDYDFENNKGYGTKKHIENIKKFGTCPIHRKSFLKNIIN